MADQPLNYDLGVQQTPLGAFAGGYQVGAGIRDDIAQQNAMRQQADAARQQQEAMQSLLMNKNAGAQEYAQATLLFPGMREQLEQSWKMKNTAQQEAGLRDMGQVYSAVASGRPDVAITMLQRRADAMEAAGADPREIQAARTQAQLIEAHPEFARTQIGMALAALPGGDKVLTGVSTAGMESRAQQQAPAKLVQEQAEARIKSAQAGAATEKASTDIELTKAQTDEARARIDKLKADADAAAGGGTLDPEKKFDFESKLRKEYSTQTANFQDVKESYGRIKAADNTGAGDIALVYAYMKMLDPGSVVREGEFATASNSAGVPAAIQNLYNKAINGERLTEGQRKTFAGQAEKLLKAAEKREKEVRGGVEQVVKSYKLNPSNVFYDGEREATPPAASGGLPPALANKGWARY